MRIQITILILILYQFLTATGFAQTVQITDADALRIAQNQFKGKDVDYFLITENNLTSWQIFVDAEPMQGWEHDCYVLTIPKSTSGDINNVKPSSQHMKLPPASRMRPLVVLNRYGSHANDKPQLPKSNRIRIGGDKRNLKTYAVIINGGYNVNANAERFWNDCSFLFQTLRHTYDIPQSNIRVLMADGTNPDEDMKDIDGNYISSPLDLDGDGVDDIQYAATEQNVRHVLQELTSTMKEDDHLLLFVTDHGARPTNTSYICLWNEVLLSPRTLAQYLKPLTDKGVSVNVVLGQCYSGGFVENLSAIGCIVSTACNAEELSWSCWWIPYDQFVYDWTSAINGRNAYGNKVDADYNMDGFVTMDEAFEFARQRVTLGEHPQFYPGPEGYASNLAIEKNLLLDISDCVSGMYVLQYIVNSEIVDVRKVALR